MGKATSFEGRPWAEGQVVIMAEDDDDPCLVQILCYLHESDCVADTEFVYRVVSPGPQFGMCFNESVDHAINRGWIKEPETRKAFM